MEFALQVKKEQIQRNFERITARIGEVAGRVGRDPGAVRFMAVTKTTPRSFPIFSTKRDASR